MRFASRRFAAQGSSWERKVQRSFQDSGAKHVFEPPLSWGVMNRSLSLSRLGRRPSGLVTSASALPRRGLGSGLGFGALRSSVAGMQPAALSRPSGQMPPARALVTQFRVCVQSRPRPWAKNETLEPRCLCTGLSASRTSEKTSSWWFSRASMNSDSAGDAWFSRASMNSDSAGAAGFHADDLLLIALSRVSLLFRLLKRCMVASLSADSRVGGPALRVSISSRRSPMARKRSYRLRQGSSWKLSLNDCDSGLGASTSAAAALG
mmetsp:Transcript_40715/g.127368  ORF Transcript_40715/g.127368 Transcript_40715/m.127368 type:complete len:264 (-) Transcript_40715:2138-2929(-)